MVAQVQVVPKTFAQHDKLVRQGIQQFDRGMQSLLVILDHQLWIGDYSSESAYLRAVSKQEGKHRTWLIRQISLARGRASLEGTDYADALTESNWRELKKFDIDHHVLILQKVITRYGKLTASRIKRVGEDMQLQAEGNDSQLHIADAMAGERKAGYILSSKGLKKTFITGGRLRDIPLHQLRLLYIDPTVHVNMYHLTKAESPAPVPPS